MAKNIVKFEIEKMIDIGRADVVFHINKENVGKLGRLKISQGNLEWCKADQTNGKTLSWDEIADVFRDQGH